MPNIDTSIIAPQNIPPPDQQQPPMGGQASPNAGGIEAVKNGIKFLKQAGMDEEQILEMLLKLVEQMNINLSEDQLRQLITMGGGAEETPMPQMGGPPPMAGGIT